MIAAFLSSPSVHWFLSEAVFAFVASIGGLLVFWGLWIEGPPNESDFSDVGAYRRHKFKAKKGWKILMTGIFLEIVVAAGFAAKEGWQVRQTAIQITKSNPINQPVSDISVSAIINLRGVPGPFLQQHDDIWVDLLEHRIGSKVPNIIYLGGFQMLIASDVQPYSHGEISNNYFGYSVRLNADRRFSPLPDGFVLSDHSPLTPKNVLDKINLLLFSIKFIPKEAEILDGSAEILVNGSFRKHFKIYGSQKVETNFYDRNPPFPGIFLYATNAPNP